MPYAYPPGHRLDPENFLFIQCALSSSPFHNFPSFLLAACALCVLRHSNTCEDWPVDFLEEVLLQYSFPDEGLPEVLCLLHRSHLDQLFHFGYDKINLDYLAIMQCLHV